MSAFGPNSIDLVFSQAAFEHFDEVAQNRRTAKRRLQAGRDDRGRNRFEDSFALDSGQGSEQHLPVFGRGLQGIRGFAAPPIECAPTNTVRFSKRTGGPTCRSHHSNGPRIGATALRSTSSSRMRAISWNTYQSFFAPKKPKHSAALRGFAHASRSASALRPHPNSNIVSRRRSRARPSIVSCQDR